MDTFSQSGKQSQISLLLCVPHHTPPNAMPVFKLAQVDSCRKAIPPLLQGGTCGPGKGGGNGGRWRGEGERLKRWDDSEARGWRVIFTPPGWGPLSQLPLSQHSHFCASPTPLTLHHPEMVPMVFLIILLICNLFYGLKKKVIISRNNMKID